MKNRKAILDQLFVVLVIGAVFALAMVAYFAWVLIAPLGVGIFNDVSNNLIISTHNETSNELTNAVTPQIRGLQNTFAQLEWFSYGLLIAGFLGFVIFAYYVRTYPFLAFIWIFFVIIFGIMAMFLSNTYQELRVDSDTITARWEADSFILQNFPAIIVSCGIFLGVILFIIPSKDQEAEGVNI